MKTTRVEFDLNIQLAYHDKNKNNVYFLYSSYSINHIVCIEDIDAS